MRRDLKEDGLIGERLSLELRLTEESEDELSWDAFGVAKRRPGKPTIYD